MGFDINDMLDRLDKTNTGSQVRDRMSSIKNSLGNIAETLQTGKAPARANTEYDAESVILPPPEVRGILPSDFQFLPNEQIVFKCQHKGGASCFKTSPSNVSKAVGALLFGIVGMVFTFKISSNDSVIIPLIFLMLGILGAFANIYDSYVYKENKKSRMLIITNKRIIDSNGNDMTAFSFSDISDLRVISDSQISYTSLNCLDEKGKPLCIRLCKLKKAGEIYNIIVQQINNQQKTGENYAGY